MCHVSQTHLPISSYSTPLFLHTHLLSSHPNPTSAAVTTRFGFQQQSRTTMMRSIGKRIPCSEESYWDGDDMAVAEILVQLLDLIPPAKPSFPAWGAKRRRSTTSQPPPPSFAKSHNNAAATSPATPLMFSPSESDDKANTYSRVSLSLYKRKLQNNEELMQSFAELTHQKDSLVKEMEAVKRHLDILRASNLELRSRKQVQIIYGLSPPALQTLHHQQQQQQQHIHYPFQLQHPSIQWSTPSVPAINKTAPVGLPDLNLSFEEVAAAGNVEGGYQASDAMTVNVNNRALASAQARKRRMQIYKEKNQNQIIRQR